MARAVGQRLRLGLAWSRWQGAVALLQGQRTAELRALVLLRAGWGTWRAVVEHVAVKRELLAVRRPGNKDCSRTCYSEIYEGRCEEVGMKQRANAQTM